MDSICSCCIRTWQPCGLLDVDGARSPNKKKSDEEGVQSNHVGGAYVYAHAAQTRHVDVPMPDASGRTSPDGERRRSQFTLTETHEKRRAFCL